MNLLDNIKESEGFRGDVYKDTLGFDTIGYGTKLPLTQYESETLLKYRLQIVINQLVKEQPFIDDLPLEKQEILFEMAYQMGVSGVLKFKKMFQALKAGDYISAAAEMLDSRWAKQTPKRAKKLSLRMQTKDESI